MQKCCLIRIRARRKMALITTSPTDTGNNTHESLEHWRFSQMDNVSLPNSSFPLAFSRTATDHALNVLAMAAIFTVMVTMGCNMEISKIKAHIRKPKGVAIAVVSQFGIMPLTAFALSKIFQLDPVEALAVLICGCCPGGNLSNILTLLSNGDLNLSIVMTGCSTFLALGMMPLLLYLYTNGNLEGKVPYKEIVFSLFMTLIPCAIGIILNEKKPQYTHLIVKVGMILLLLMAIPMIVLMVVSLGSSILLVILSPRLVGTSVLMPFLGFFLGYILSSFFKFNNKCKRTICLETGCQNMNLCLTILKMAFAAEVIGPLYFFPTLYTISQLGEGLLLVVVFRSCGNTKEPNDSVKVVSEAIDRTGVKNEMETNQPESLRQSSSRKTKGCWKKWSTSTSEVQAISTSESC
ncbi:sodium/bile acid cotransporter isoform X2 [Sceloporus undulatus]|uniref:sodium/bile acid cotransporter isoform X2 n=1 Tax=Sceloporus undulatus TaxID=8520 RepID=UPI001C4C521E|nr:sodium/bile acid cotransporter isoform X2 [Sceloporus undulatus]